MEKVGKVKNLCKVILNSGNSPLLLGDRGIGKTSIAFELARELGLDTVYLNISQTSPENLNFPYIEDGVLDFKTLDFNDKLVILDEITNRNPEMHSLLQSLVLEKRIGNVKFRNLYFIATGNRLENSNLVVDLSRPLIERFVTIDFPVPSKEEWAMYTLSKNGSERFVNFIMQGDDNLYYLEENEGESNLQNIPSPRNNTRTAIMLNELENTYGNDTDMIFQLVKGSSGTVVARAYVQYLEAGRYYNYDMFKNGDMPKNNNEVLALTTSVVSRLKENKITLNDVDEVLGYIMNNHRNLRDYFIAYIKLAFPNNSGSEKLTKFASTNPNSNFKKVLVERMKAEQ